MRKYDFKLLGAASALALMLAMPAVSQAASDNVKPRGGFIERLDLDGSGDISKEEYRAAAEKRFGALDADSDGLITKADMDSFKEKHREGVKKRMGDPAERFAKIDADNDGKITLDEWKEVAQKRASARSGDDAEKMARHLEFAEKHFAAMDADGDGVLTAEEMKEAGKKHFKHAEKKDGKREGKRGDFFSRLDADGDGKVTKEEYLASSDKHFEKLDRNGDGKLTKDEFRPHHPGKGAKDEAAPVTR